MPYLYSILNNMNFFLRNFFKIIPSDFFAPKFPVSAKGILYINGKIALVKNERSEWEPPGGKMEPSETLEECVVREIKEELNINAVIDHLFDAFKYKVADKVNVLCVIYLCNPVTIDEQQIKLSFEHNEYGLFTLDEIQQLNMKGNYKPMFRKLQSQV
jgi:mutator protein MutT